MRICSTCGGCFRSRRRAHPWGEMVKVHDYFARIHPTLFFLLKTNGTGRTLAQRLVYATAMLAGPQQSGLALIAPVLFATRCRRSQRRNRAGPLIRQPSDGRASDHRRIACSHRRPTKLGSRFNVDDPLIVTEQQLSSGGWINTIT